MNKSATIEHRDRNVVEVWGQSNSNGRSWPATAAANCFARNAQMNVLLAQYAKYNVLAENPWDIDTTWGSMRCPFGPPGSFGAPGIPAIGLAQSMSADLSCWIRRLAVLQMGYGGTDSFYWSTTYWGIYAPWISARISELQGTTTCRFIVIYQGESNAINDTVSTWRGHWETIIAARRLYWNNPTLPVVVVQIPTTTPISRLAEIRTSQAALVAATPHAHLVVDENATMGSGPDIDGPSTERIGALIAAMAHEIRA